MATFRESVSNLTPAEIRPAVARICHRLERHSPETWDEGASEGNVTAAKEYAKGLEELLLLAARYPDEASDILQTIGESVARHCSVPILMMTHTGQYLGGSAI